MSLGGTRSNDQNWKVFRKDTECGRLLSRLYGSNVGSSCNINYPKLNTKEGNTNRSPWGVTGDRKGGKTKIKERAGSVRVPKVGKTNHSCSIHDKLSSLPRRKTEVACRSTILAFTSYRSAYRPPNRSVTSSATEKGRLSDLFERGGKGLPQELITLPLQKERKLEKERTEVGPSKSRMANQIYYEIQERRRFQEEMENSSAGNDSRIIIVSDITERMRELMKLDQDLARQLMHN